MESFGIIYKATNKVNGNSYIGRTTRLLKDRIYLHIHKAFKYNTPYKFHRALREFKEDSFEWEVIDNTNSLEDSYEKEMYWIQHYNTFSENGYNMDKGGCGRTGFTTPEDIRIKQSISCGAEEFHVFTTEGKYVKTVISLSLFAEEINASASNVCSVLKARKNSIKGYILIYVNEYNPELLVSRMNRVKKRRKFEVRDTILDEPIGIWDNQVTCSKELGVDRLSISKCLKGKTLSMNGYKFNYI